MVELATQWKLRRRVYDPAGNLIDTQWPYIVSTYHDIQFQMMSQAVADKIDLGFGQLNSLDSTSCDVEKPSGTRRVYAVLQA